VTMTVFSGARLRSARHAAGLTPADVGDFIGSKFIERLAGYESGARAPSATTVALLADLIGIDPGELFEEVRG
jgi:transcriptional regulator with XRE-family HTH domain